MTERLIDSPGLFGLGVGTATYGDIKCEICNTMYNEGNDERGDYNGDAVRNTTFAGLEVCECCFAAIETSVINHMPQILQWYAELLRTKRKNLELDEARLYNLCLELLKRDDDDSE